MKRQTEFARMLRKFLTSHLVDARGCKPGTVESYGRAFCLFLEYADAELGIPADLFELDDFTRGAVVGFLGWLEDARGCAASTRNQRKAALDSFARFLEYEHPECLPELQAVLSIPLKRAPQPEVSYLSGEGTKALLAAVDVGVRDGLRDYAMLSVMCAAGVRVSELTGLRPRDVSLGEPPTVLVHGKGGKARYVPLASQVVPVLRAYMRGYGLDQPERCEEPLFQNHMGGRLTRQGVRYILLKYAERARAEHPEAGIPEDCSPHKLRHTFAMELVEADVDVLHIRDLMGHASVRTTEVYARTYAKRKRDAVEAASKGIVPPEEPRWDNDEGLREWLKNLGRRR